MVLVKQNEWHKETKSHQFGKGTGLESGCLEEVGGKGEIVKECQNTEEWRFQYLSIPALEMNSYIKKKKYVAFLPKDKF